MSRRTVKNAMLGVGLLLLSLAPASEKSLRQAIADEDVATSAEETSADETNSEDLAAPAVRILAGISTTVGDAPFVSCSCETANPNQAPLMFVGYRADAFDPPLVEGQVSPIYVVELRRAGVWEEHPIGWCGWGMDGINMVPGGAGSFGFAVPLEPAWEAVRVGIRWSPPLDFSTAEPDAFKTAWSEPLLREQVDAPPKSVP